MTMARAQALPDTCVTVFGFPHNDTSKVIAMFHKHGYILRFFGALDMAYDNNSPRGTVEPTSNWMHLQYEDSLQAKHVRHCCHHALSQ